ncbi:MAG TPA: SDR family oxidoreductase [Steroidobacteraceae bacterium]|nr:SDR family oxidoreductase [Steroidobacteraceae bacterium]
MSQNTSHPTSSSKNRGRTPSLGKAVVTGASTGIGALYADRLARRGYDLILVARNRERLEALARHLADTTHRSVEVLAADLADRSGLREVEERLQDDPTITMLVNNAGVAAAGPLLASDVDKMEAMIDINVTALTRLTYAAVPGFVKRGKGTVVNISSIVAVYPERLNGVYGATKAFVLAFSQSLQHELSDKGIRVQAVLPGATRTPLWALAGVDIEQLPKEIVMDAGEMVDAALAGLDQGEFATVPALPELADWNAFESARLAMAPKLSRSAPAARYAVATKALN